MNWSFRIGRLAGIDVRVHATFGILLAWVALAGYGDGRGHTAVFAGLFLIGLVFGIVVLHELGHALMARRFGIRTHDITLLPIGGVARLERMPDEPWQEFLVAIAGPGVNAVLALALYGLSFVVDDDLTLRGERTSVITELIGLNVGLLLFNLLPAFPMDGGRAMRALLALRTDSLRATRIAASLGQTIAVLLGLFGVFYNPLLVLIAVFVWMGASAEARMAQVGAALLGIPVSAVMVQRFAVLSPDTPLRDAAAFALEVFQAEFPVSSDNHLVGLLTRGALLHAQGKMPAQTPVGELMQRNFQSAAPSEMLDVALKRLQASAQQALPVVHQGELVGLLPADRISDLINAHRAR